jgi:hypothetical protein
MVDHEDRTMTVELSDSSSDDNIRLDDFLDQLRTLRAALRETERLVSRQEPSLYFRIKHLRKDSPPVVTLEAVSDTMDERARPQYASYVVRSLTTNLRVIANRKRLPSRIDYPALESYRELTMPAEKRRLRVRIQAGKNSVLINSQLRQTIDRIAGEDEFSFGSVSGKIEAINVHDKNRKFQIFPTVGPSRIVGTFRTKDRKLFASAVDHYVTVYGKLRYKKWDKFPYAISAESVEVHDLVALPGLEALGGIAPNATGQLTSQEFIDRVRDEW